ncbi:MAG: hypothetical protein J7M39_02380 [Anaerolineae bacterium]|nr:hypothetical protein [Anaerolineae bacterium]
MGPGTIQKTITLFEAALRGLGSDIPLSQLEMLGIMVHEAMTVQTRSFHTPEHIFELSDASNPIQALAALFHDVVYYEVDQGFTLQVQAVLSPYFEGIDGQIQLATDIDPCDLYYHLTLDVFGFYPGQRLLPARGQNEFLSALLMNEKLKGIVRLRELAEITACIEATIPFRGRSASGESPAEVLERRLRNINLVYGLGMTETEIQAAVAQAVVFSNKDVETFSVEDTGRFLDNTWKLLPESNPSLRLHGIYAISSYRLALQKMETFLNQLDPDTIFNRYLGQPPLGQYERMRALAHRNVHTGRQYLGLKLLAIGVLEALAIVSGGDAPVALFMGTLGETDDGRRLDDFLPDVSAVPSVDEMSTLFGLLAFGRASSSSFDMQNSPLSLFLFKLLGWDQAQMLLGEAKAMFAGEIDARESLARMPTGMVVSVANACAAMANTRSAALRSYANERVSEKASKRKGEQAKN